MLSYVFFVECKCTGTESSLDSFANLFNHNGKPSSNSAFGGTITNKRLCSKRFFLKSQMNKLFLVCPKMLVIRSPIILSKNPWVCGQPNKIISDTSSRAVRDIPLPTL